MGVVSCFQVTVQVRYVGQPTTQGVTVAVSYIAFSHSLIKPSPSAQRYLLQVMLSNGPSHMHVLASCVITVLEHSS